MTKRFLLLGALLLASPSPLSPLMPGTVCGGFLPPNDRKIPVGDINALGIDQAAFDAVLARVESVYGPIFAARGKRLRVNRHWDDATVNADAMQFNDTWVINMYGGLARHKAVTAEGFALVACHEIGHHVGGYPKVGGRWPTNEGGADYFAALKCLRRVFTGGEDTSKLEAAAVKACAAAHAAPIDRKFCEVAAQAGKSVAFLFQDLSGRPVPPSFSTPDSTVVAKTIDEHPQAQCRLDTYFQGALCAKPVGEEVADGSPAPGTCTAAQGFATGLRPKCWYRAPDGQAAPASRSSEQVRAEILEALARTLSDRRL